MVVTYFFTITNSYLEGLRKIRDEISLEIMDMNYIEEREYINKLLAESKTH